MDDLRPSQVSAVIITKNEEANLAACLESLAWADEIVVLDCGSTDRTVEIARRYTDRIHVEEWRGYGPQKSRAVELARGEWILSVDADERVTPELAKETRRVIEVPGHGAFAVRRRNIYRGRWIRHGGWWPDRVVRLFRKGEARFSGDMVHESLAVPGSVGRLRGVLLHESFRSAADFLERALRYAPLGAADRHSRGRTASAWTAFTHASFEFLKTYVLQRGFLDGAAGLLVAASNAVGTFYRYMILREMCGLSGDTKLVCRGTQNLSSAAGREPDTTDVEDKYCVPRQTRTGHDGRGG